MTLVPLLATVLFAVVLAYAFAFPLLGLRYRYRVEDRFLVIQRTLLGWIPLAPRRVPLNEIAAVERCRRWRCGRRCLNYGAVLSANGVLLILRRRSLLYDAIRVTPEDPEALMDEVMARAGAQDTTPPSESAAPPERLPVWVTDALAVLSVLGWVALAAASLIASRGSSAPQEMPPSVGMSPWLIACAVAIPLSQAIVLLMGVDGVRRATEEGSQRLWAWGLGVFLIPPLAWVYYLREYRPRQQRRDLW